MTVRTLQIFISSPKDVIPEREIAKDVIQRLDAELSDKVKLLPILWEDHPMQFTESFQQQISQPSDADVFICILWSRLGTPLEERFTRDDGSRYESGTEYEFELAHDAHRKNGKPRLYVYRKTEKCAPVEVNILDPSDSVKCEEMLNQANLVQRFFRKWFRNAEDTYSGAFNDFASTDAFGGLLESHLRKVIPELCEDSSTGATDPSQRKIAAKWTKGSPFRGLSSFNVNHSPVFCGRRDATDDILTCLRRMREHPSRFLVIYGTSGCGKSSLIRAGVISTLMKPGVVAGVDQWRYAILRPGGPATSPFDGLLTALLHEKAFPELTEDIQSSQSRPERIHADSLIATITGFIKGRKGVRSGKSEETPDVGTLRLVLVVDQLEELFTAAELSDDDRQEFVKTLFSLAANPHVFVVCTLRVDFLPSFVEMTERLQEPITEYRLEPPTHRELRNDQ